MKCVISKEWRGREGREAGGVEEAGRVSGGGGTVVREVSS